MSGEAAPGAAAKSHRRLVTLVGVGVGCALLALVAYAPTARRLSRDRGEGLTVADARGRVLLDIPPGASDIRFYQHTRPDKLVFVDFTIDEPGFLEWAGRYAGKMERVGGTVTVWPRLGFGDRATAVRITDGYAFRNNPAPGMANAVVVNYDRARRRAYYAYWSEPRAGEG